MLVESPAWGTAPRCGDGNTRHGASLLLRTADRSEMQPPPSLSQSFAPVGHQPLRRRRPGRRGPWCAPPGRVAMGSAIRACLAAQPLPALPQDANGYTAQAADRRTRQRRTDGCRPLKWSGHCRRLIEGKQHYQCSSEQMAVYPSY